MKIPEYTDPSVSLKGGKEEEGGSGRWEGEEERRERKRGKGTSKSGSALGGAWNVHFGGAERQKRLSPGTTRREVVVASPTRAATLLCCHCRLQPDYDRMM
ncbi:hypothetical protein E2C01_037637 [Portunus trituberculatus]|uniref:Uncharacterized protein n=1 Tax=Portunus trituberculatus TaxID=210409 RepID=A0A5B7FEM4_PORTR|nr:hypothetical protein [Portunus trituberculatus]